MKFRIPVARFATGQGVRPVAKRMAAGKNACHVKEHATIREKGGTVKKIDFRILIVAVLALGVGVNTVACAKKVAPQAAINLVQPAPAKPAPPPSPAPTISLSAHPSLLTRGQSTTLTWNSSNATSVTLDGGMGTVSSSGQRVITPLNSTTYTATANGAGGSAVASTRVTVEESAVTPPNPPRLSDTEFFQNRVQDIFFDYDKYDIRSDQQAIADNDARALAERSNIKFEIEGYCDERGSEKYNLALGDRRANEAKAYLIAHGVSSDRIDTVSYGKERPFDPGHNEEAWAKNRRDHLVLK